MMSLESVITDDDEIDDLEAAIDQECLSSIAMRQPVMRRPALCFRRTQNHHGPRTDRRPGVNIAKKAKVLNRYPLLKPLVDIPKMKVIATEMVSDSLKSFEENDSDSQNRSALRR